MVEIVVLGGGIAAKLEAHNLTLFQRVEIYCSATCRLVFSCPPNELGTTLAYKFCQPAPSHLNVTHILDVCATSIQWLTTWPANFDVLYE